MDLSSLELDIWQETARCGSLVDALGRALACVATVAPVASVAIRRMDASRSAVETIAIVHGSNAPHAAFSPELTVLPPRLLPELVDDRFIAGNTALATDSARAVVPKGLHGGFVLFALGDVEKPFAIAVLLAEPNTELSPEYLPVVRTLCAPLTSLVRRELDRRPDDAPGSGGIRPMVDGEEPRSRGPGEAILTD